MALQAKPPGPFDYPTLLSQWGYYSNMADTTNATYYGGIDVPLEDFSGAKISILSDIAKYLTKIMYSPLLFADFTA